MNPFEYNQETGRSVRERKDLGFEEVYLDVNMEERNVLEDERDDVNYRMLGLLLLLVFTVLFGRLYFLQGMRGSSYRAMAEGNKSRQQYILPPRGLIVDEYGKLIAGNLPSFDLDVVTSDLPKNEAEFNASLTEVSQITGQGRDQLYAAILAMTRDSYQPQTLVQNISKDNALVLISRKDQLKGFSVENNPIRDYKDPLAFGHLVGYTGKITQDEIDANKGGNYLLNDYYGKTGLEAVYEKYLRGTPGQKPMEIDAQGKYKRSLPEIPPVSGDNLKLNVDYDLQKVLYDSLTKMMAKNHTTRAAAVISEPKTGKIRALISLPGFDNNWFARGIKPAEYKSLLDNPDVPLLDRAVSGTYPPGSTVKPMLALAGLTEGIVKPETKILDDGVIRVGSYTFYGYKRSGLGLMDVYSAIARSSDIYFYTLGGGRAGTNIQGLGPEKLADWYRKFHLGEALGIDLPHEKGGLVPDPDWKKQAKNEPWYLGDTYHYSIGQGDLLVTPLQVNSWTATIANGGKVMQPYILDEVSGSDSKVVFKNSPKVLSENFLDPQWVRVVQEGMRQTVTIGSAQSLKTLPIEVSGKTGTAQFDARDLARTHAWFTSYAPSNDPQIAVTVLIEAGGEGSTWSVPVAKDVYAWWAANRYNK
ncbi:MAG: penicillin-binding protein 2 [Candidatus Saccharibacteria bacterium]